MDAATLQQKIYYGYSIVGSKIGYEYTIYRSASPIEPIAPANIPSPNGTVNASFSVQGNYLKYQNYGVPQWQCYADGRILQPWDYLQSNDYGIWFIASMDPLLPILSVQCNEVITITRPATPSYGPNGGYAGRTRATDVTVYQNVPASVLLQSSKGTNNPVKLPTDTKQPLYMVLMPIFGDTPIETTDLVTDSSGKQYIIWQVELTNLGYRLRIQEEGV